jgi:hypothetical protein
MSARNQASEDPGDNPCANDGHDNRPDAILKSGRPHLLPLLPSGIRPRDLRVRASFNHGRSWQTAANQGTELWAAAPPT